MVRLRPIALTLMISVLAFTVMWLDKSEAAAGKIVPPASNAPQVGGKSPGFSSKLVAVRSRTSGLKSRQPAPASKSPDISSAQGDSSQGTSQSLTIEKKSTASIPSEPGEKSYPSYKNNNQDLTLSLPQAIQIALARNLTMADSRLAIQEKEYQRREAYSDFFPSVTLQYSGTWDRYWNPLFTFALDGTANSRYSGSQQQYRWQATHTFDPTKGVPPLYPYRIDPYRQFSGALTITQPIFSGGKLINDYKYARLGVDYTGIQYEVNRQDLMLNVTQAYYQMMQAEKLLQVANAAIRALEALVNQTKEFYKAGTVAKVDVLSTEGQLAQARIQRTQSISDIAQNQATLNYLLRNPQETPVQIIEDMSYNPSQYRLPDAYNIAAANRLEIRQANISADQAIALIKSAKADVMPYIDVAVSGTRYNDDWNIVDPEGFNDWRIQGLLTWTFDMFRKRSTVAERRATQARTFVNRELLVETVMNEVKQAYEDMQRNYKNIMDNKAAVEFQTENFRINQERYKEQVATYVEVLDAQRQLQLAQGNFYMSICGFKISQATLERKMGLMR